MALLIRTDGSIESLPRGVDGLVELTVLQKAVGGYIEVLHLSEAGFDYMICNEEGKLQRLPINDVATMIYRHDVIVGDVVLLTSKETNKEID